MRLDNNSIISDVRGWLKDSGSEISLYELRVSNGHEVIMLELKGDISR